MKQQQQHREEKLLVEDCCLVEGAKRERERESKGSSLLSKGKIMMKNFINLFIFHFFSCVL